MDSHELHWLGIYELSRRIGTGELSPLDVVDALIERIEALNPKILGFIEVTAEAARVEAIKAEEEIAAGRKKGPLHGIPYGVKDIIDTAGVRTTRGSSVFMNRVPDEDAGCIDRLREAGAILIGKCLTQEFASGPLSHNPHFGTARNPWDLSRITGGSSTGSAASVSAGLCPAALGTDTGGSIRAPSALCGIVGLKPTNGRVSLLGVCPNSMSYDQAGPMVRSARDAALFLQGMVGYEPRDPYSREVPISDFSERLNRGVRGMRVGLCPGLTNHAEVDAEVQQAFERAVEVFRSFGAEVKTLEFTEGDRFASIHQAVIGAEFIEFHRPIFEKYSDSYADYTRMRIEECTKHADLDRYIRAQREREVLSRNVLKLFHEVDVILTPALPCIAPKADNLKATINGKEVDYSLDQTMPFLTPQNMTGCPSLVVPMGFSAKDGMSVSLQIIGRRWEEAEVLRAGHAYEEATPEIRARRPVL